MDIFSTQTMLGMIQAADFRPKTFLKSRYFSNEVSFPTNQIAVDIVDALGRKVAAFVNPKIGGEAVARQGYRTDFYEAPEVSPMRVTTADDLLHRMAGESIYTSLTPAERAARVLGSDLRDLDEIITRREEVMCAEALFKGKVTVKGDGYDEEVVYWDSDSSKQPKTTLAKKWDATDANPLADIRLARREMVKSSGFVPTELILGSKAADALIALLTDKDFLDKRRVDLGQIEPRFEGSGAIYLGHLRDSNLDLYSYEEWYTDEAGKTQPIVPENLALLASPNVRTTMAYGVVAVVNESTQEQMLYAERRVPISWVQRANPSGRVVQIKSRPLPIVHQPLGFHVIEVLASA